MTLNKGLHIQVLSDFSIKLIEMFEFGKLDAAILCRGKEESSPEGMVLS